MAQWDEEVDLICVGSGIGGCAAAITGAEAGMKVVLVEKSPKLGGTTTWSLGIVWVGSGHLAQRKRRHRHTPRRRALISIILAAAATIPK